MAFLIPIPITLVIGMVWAAWTSRPRRPADPVTTVEEWSRAIQRLAPTAEDERRRRRELARSA